ncbi:hypothetical protein [Rhodococcus sp. NPDC127528]|uniref:hypothetical protein n=1 Tax=unclassified Rhodococcus (in: high G+C Gram-positive bacteria) TaxID=192944 RepID=UPI00363C6E52
MTTTFVPRRWKVWLLTVCGIYPVLTVMVTVLTPLMGGGPLPARLAVIVPVAVASMVWVVMPFLTRRFHGWLSR